MSHNQELNAIREMIGTIEGDMLNILINSSITLAIKLPKDRQKWHSTISSPQIPKEDTDKISAKAEYTEFVINTGKEIKSALEENRLEPLNKRQIFGFLRGIGLILPYIIRSGEIKNKIKNSW